jgi:tRNA(adenine34) deaminase
MDLVAVPETTFSPFDEACMARALALAEAAGTAGEVPVGAVLARGEVILGEGANGPIGARDPSAHAELVALRAAARAEGNYRLPGTTLYVTLEPCAMCAGALIHARVARLVFATREPRAGAVRSQFQLLEQAAMNHQVGVEEGLLEEASATLLRRFFRARRPAPRAQESV